MNLTWKDFLAARALYQNSLLPFPVISAELQAYEALETRSSWLDYLCQKQALDPSVIPQIYAQLAKFEFMRAEAHYGRAAEKHGVAPSLVKSAQEQQKAESFQQRLSHYIRQAQPLPEDVQTQILDSARAAFNADTLRLLGLARDKLMAKKKRSPRPSARFFRKQSAAQLSQAYGLEKAVFNPAAPKQAPTKAERRGSGSWSQEAFTQLNNKLKKAQKNKNKSASNSSWGSKTSSVHKRRYKVKTKEERLYDKLGFEIQEGSRIDEKFEVVSLLGKGGMGLVYRVRSPEHDQELALKLAFPQMNESKEEEVSKRFEREILVTRSIQHRNVARVFDSGVLQCGLRYMAMEIVPGEDLKSQIVREGAVPPDQALKLCKEIVLALQACHSKDIVHRDLKPENIRVYQEGEETRIRVMDFGLSRLLNEAEVIKQEIYLTQQTTVSGSPAYMAPESITDPGDVDVRCDLYSVGVTLFELVTGSLPFSGRSIHEFLDHHLYSAVPRLEDRCPELSVPNSFESFIRKLMEKERDLRIQSCSEALTFIARIEEDMRSPAQSPKRGEDASQKGVVKKLTRFFGKKPL